MQWCLFHKVHLIIFDDTQPCTVLEIWVLHRCKFRAYVLLYYNFMILLQTSKKLVHPNLDHIQKDYNKRKTFRHRFLKKNLAQISEICLKWELSPKFFMSSFHSKRKSLRGLISIDIVIALRISGPKRTRSKSDCLSLDWERWLVEPPQKSENKMTRARSYSTVPKELSWWRHCKNV